MEKLPPLTFDLSEEVNEDDFFIALDCVYKLLFNQDKIRKESAKRKLVNIFAEEDFEVTHVYCGDH